MFSHGQDEPIDATRDFPVTPAKAGISSGDGSGPRIAGTGTTGDGSGATRDGSGAVRNRPRWSRLVVAVLVALLPLATPLTARADDEDSRLTWSVAPASADGPDGRGQLEYVAQPGTQQRDHVVVSNLGTEPITVELAALDARQTPENPFELLAPDEPSSRVGAWLRLDETAVEVPARGSVVVGFTLDLPADAEPGDHAGGLVAVSTASSDDGPDVQYRVGTRAYVRVAGPVTARLGVQPEADFTADPLLVTPGSLTITAELANVGNVRLTPAVRATVSSLFGLWSQSVPLTEVGELLPGGTATSRTELTGVPPLGPLWIALDLPRAQSWGQEIGGEVAVESTIITVWAAPWAIPLGVLLTLAVGWLLWRRTKRGSLRGGQRVAVDHPVPERLEPRP